MPAPEPGPLGQGADTCVELRHAAVARCDEARAAAQDHALATERTRLLRRDLVAAEHAVATAEAAADPGPGRAQKDTAREAYQAARGRATSEAELREAAATWAHALDRVNRGSRLAARTLARVRAQATSLERAAREADRIEQAARIRAESAESACLDARVRLAACEERLLAPADPGHVATPPSPTGGGAAGPATAGAPAPWEAMAGGGSLGSISPIPHGEPLVVEAMVCGDRRALELAATVIAEHGRVSPAAIRVQLQEFVDAVESAASQAGYLLFDAAHHFWSHLAVNEARDVLAALARLGFRFEPAEGWHAGRVPTPTDLAMALAYAGLDARRVRGVPSSEELRALPASIGVDARSFLAAFAPNLAMDQLVPALEMRAAKLAPLWDAWGLVRPVLLSPRRSLGTLPG